MLRLRELSVPVEEDGRGAVLRAAARELGVPEGEIRELKVRRRSVDARKKNDIRLIYTVDAALCGDEAAVLRHCRSGKAAPAEAYVYRVPTGGERLLRRPVIAGFGPAGMFAGLVLALAGARPLILERGRDVETRERDVERFWRTGILDPRSNVQFGEGGAGAFSDGKLNTGTKNPRIQWVLDRFVEFGAGEDVAFEARPHVGTDRLKRVVKNLRERIVALGGQVRFGAALTGIRAERGRIAGVTVNGTEELACDDLLLAIGHSARDTFAYLHALGVPMEPKPFAMGARIEHRQSELDRCQYGAFAGRPALGAAEYRLAVHTPRGSAFTFCMCPGGYVVAAASEEGGVCTNGMSYSGRSGENANSALLVGLDTADFPYPGVLGGMEWQRELERRAFEAAGGDCFAPAQTVGDFLGSPSKPSVEPTYRPGVRDTDLHTVLPERITAAMELALPELGRKLPVFRDRGAVLTGPETRSSSPVRILRDETRQSPLRGLWPCGEGAGYAGGITSAAVDGMLTAEAVLAGGAPEKAPVFGG